VRVVVISDGLRWVVEIGEVTEGMNLFGFFFNGFFFLLKWKMKR
jgi:hypothetical protein